VLRLRNEWAWDFWLADDGANFHLFFLVAPKSLGDPERRHLSASVGHAVSTDLRRWHHLPNALQAGHDGPDAVATWTGSVVQDGTGKWVMFYTGMRRWGAGYSQRICLARSSDLVHWTKDTGNPVLVPDARWYDVRLDRSITGEDLRDPFVYRDPHGDGWHMLFTARAIGSPEVNDLGVVGHATSPDLLTWNTGPPLSSPGAGFQHLEVPQVEVVDGRAVLVFSCLEDMFAGARRGSGTGGVWAVAADSVTGPFDVAHAHALTDRRFYSGRLVRERDGSWSLMAFLMDDADGRFVGAVSDPMPVRWDDHGRLEAVSDR